jgi:VWFA-related protein
MKTADRHFSSKLIKSLACIGLIGLGLIAIAESQSKNEKEYVIRLGVEEVRLDAVVLDKKGRQIADLTVNDFEILQNSANQKLTSAIYINEHQLQPQPQSKPTKQVLSDPVAMLTQNDVRRTFIFIIDNINMNFVQFCDARTSLRKFIRAQMQPGDLAAIVPTANGAFIRG